MVNPIPTIPTLGSTNCTSTSTTNVHGHVHGRCSSDYHSNANETQEGAGKPIKTIQQRLEEFNQIHVQSQIDCDDVPECDRHDYMNPQKCVQYANQIFHYLLKVEHNYKVNPNYMQNQPDLNDRMRAILLDWIVEVHLKFKLLPATLFLTVNIIDRYLDKQVIQKEKLQLVGAAALFIACKYEEIYAPELKDFVYITDNAYNKKEILQMEFSILQNLQFQFNYPSPLNFLQRYMKFTQCNDIIANLAKYLIELSLIDYKMTKYSSSLLSLATLYTSVRILNKEWNSEKFKFIEKIYAPQQIKQCAKDLCLILQDAQKNQLQAVRKKFSLPQFKEVGRIKIES